VVIPFKIVEEFGGFLVVEWNLLFFLELNDVLDAESSSGLSLPFLFARQNILSYLSFSTWKSGLGNQGSK
jgi:hypothetical protein